MARRHVRTEESEGTLKKREGGRAAQCQERNADGLFSYKKTQTGSILQERKHRRLVIVRKEKAGGLHVAGKKANGLYIVGKKKQTV